MAPLIPSKAQIITYPWPQDSELLGDQKYEIRVRSLEPSDTTFGDWIDLDEFYSYQRSYPDHWKCGDDAGTDFMSDRSLTFVCFAFTGSIEVEVTQKLSSQKARRVELAPKAFGISPHYFDGKTVRFAMDRPEYLSVNFDFGPGDESINRDDNRAGGFDIKHGVMIFPEIPEALQTHSYPIPEPDDPGVVVWGDSVDIDEILAADIIYFPAGEHEMRNHKDRWERNSSWDQAEAEGNWVRTRAEYEDAKLYRGKLNMGKAGQKVYLAPGAIVYGGFHARGKDNIWIYGKGIISGRKHLMHEIVMPEGSAPIDYNEEYILKTATKEAFCHMSDGAVYDGVMFLEAWHHTCPSGKNSTYRRTKLIGWCSNNDGIRPASGSLADRIFIKTSDDYDYARGDHTVRNAVFWPMVNGGLGQMGWNDLGDGYAKYYNMHVINTEWHLDNPSKGNIGVLSGGPTNEGIQLRENILQDIFIENRTNYLVLVDLDNVNNSPLGFLKDFLFKNITTEYPFSNPAGNTVKQKLTGRENTWLENWTFTNVFVDGVLLNWDNYQDYFDITLSGENGNNTDNANRIRNMRFDTDGEILQIGYSVSGGGQVRPAGRNGTIEVAKGMDQTIHIIPDAGYRLKKLYIDGRKQYEFGNPACATRIQSYLFENVSEEHVLAVEFEAGSDTFDLPPILKLSSPEVDSVPPPVPGAITIDSVGENQVRLKWGTSKDPSGEVRYQLNMDGTLIRGIADTAYLLTGLDCQREYAFKVRAGDEAGNLSAYTPELKVRTSTCTFRYLPGVIQAEEFKAMQGVVVEDCLDEGGGKNITSIDPGDWTEYSTGVMIRDQYLFTFRAAAAGEGGRIQILADGTEVGSLDIPGTGGEQNWDSIQTVIPLEVKLQPLRLIFSGEGNNLFKLNWIGVERYENTPVLPDHPACLRIYPNPFSDHLVVEYGAGEIELLDILGRTISIECTRLQTGCEYNTESLKPGIYFLRLGPEVYRIIKA